MGYNDDKKFNVYRVKTTYRYVIFSANIDSVNKLNYSPLSPLPSSHTTNNHLLLDEKFE